MSQHDLNIANQSFPSFRSDLNNALSAINSSHSGSTTPSGAVAGTIWLDTTNATIPLLKYYDGVDNITLATINHSTNTVDFNDSSISTPLAVTGNATAGAELRLPEDTDNGTNYVALKAPDTIASNLTLTLPSADGTSGQALTTNGSGVLSFASSPAGFRNIVINGDMQIAQRSTSVASISSSGYYTVDRFQLGLTSLGTWTQSQSTDVPTGQGFAKSTKLDCTTADATPSAGDIFVFQQRFEGQNLQYLKKGTASALSTTLSFWVKSTKTGTFIAELVDDDNTRQISKSYTVNTTNTWEKKTITFEGDTSGALDNDNASSLRLFLWLGAGTDWTSGTLQTTWASTTSANRAVGQVNIADSTSNDWYITGVQLEAGTSATDFEFLPIDVSLARCQRYFYQIQGNASNSTILGIGFSNDGTNSQSYFKFPTTMRSAPTITGSSGLQVSDGNSYTINVTAVTGNSVHTDQMSLQATVASGVTVFRGAITTLTGSTASFLALSSEL